ncbi:hypothetical protein B0H21DRAFT_698533, partial [Amylocystis lapponica]
NINNEDASNGGSALHDVEDWESKKRTGGTRGPRNDTLQHWHAPKATMDNKGKCWLCKYCGTLHTFERQVDSANFDDEPRRPFLSNLTSHTKDKHDAKIAELKSSASGVHAPAGGDSLPRTDHGYGAASARLMEKFLEDGKLNPHKDPTQKGFLCLFAAWILEEDLPFTTVHNVLVEIFVEMHGEVVKELAAVNSWVAERDNLELLALSASDWNLLKQLGQLLGHFADVTRTISLSKTPTLPWVLPMYEHMKDALQKTIDSTQLPEISNAAKAGLQKLMTYYTLALECQFNITWFNKLGVDHKDKAWTLFKHVFEQYEKTTPKPQDTPSAAPVDTRASSFLASLTSVVDLPEESSPTRSELDRWQDGEGGRGDLYYPLV